MSKTKLQRAVDATLEKINELLNRALDGDRWAYRDIDNGGCAFCVQFKNYISVTCRFSNCDDCPISQIEETNPHSHYACVRPVLRPLMAWGEKDGAVPAILAAMIYLHGFVDD